MYVLVYVCMYMYVCMYVCVRVHVRFISFVTSESYSTLHF